MKVKQMFRSSGLVFFVVVATSVAHALHAGAELVLNGSFEDTNGTMNINAYGDGLGPLAPLGLDFWVSNGASGNYYERSPTNYNGDYSVAPQNGTSYVILGANTGVIGKIYQPLSVTAGVQYTVSFWEVNRSSQGAVTGIDAGFFSDTDLLVPVSGITTANNAAAGGWQQSTFTFTPSQSENLYLGFKANSGAPWGSLLDNVSVIVPVPEPSMLALALVGLATTATARTYRRRRCG